MNSNRIEDRITDLLILTGISNEQTIEELTDHYLSHIEGEVKRGINLQKAIRETFQDIANIDASLFKLDEKKHDRKGLLFFLLTFIGIAFYLSYPTQNTVNKNNISPNIDNIKEEVSSISPPSGMPILQLELKVSSEFGMRLNPFRQQKESHKGIDIRAKVGTEVLSAGQGIVKEAGYREKSGNYIIIQHPGNYITKYYHLSHIEVAKNEKVDEGQLIGKVGNSGLSMMPHLHFEVLKNEVPVNPRNYISP